MPTHYDDSSDSDGDEPQPTRACGAGVRGAPLTSNARERRYKPRRRKVIPFLKKLVQLLQEEPDVIRRAARARNQFSRRRRET